MDRRSGKERRYIPRNPVSIEIEWESSNGRRKGTVSDISHAGCFVLSGGEVIDGEAIRLFLPLGDGIKVEFSGEIANHVFEIGFAVHFVSISDAQRQINEGLIASATK